MSAALVLGPIVRYVDETRATVWVETDRPCRVEVLGHRAPTFRVGAHHYGIVVVEGLSPGVEYPYSVHVDGEARWPEAGAEPSVIRTADPNRPLRLRFGSCRIAADPGDDFHGPDALVASALQMREQPHEEWPDALVLVGDQVYADAGDQSVPSAGGFEEFTRLYRAAWSSEVVRWVLSCVPSTMIFDDHDVMDDWNTSAAWLTDREGQDGWERYLTGAVMAYWLYQHLGNLTPGELADDPMLGRLRQSDDGEDELRRFAATNALRTGGDPRTTHWSFARDFRGSGRARLVTIDVRNSRVLEPGRRLIVDDDEWAWIEERSTGEVDHLLLATSLPWLLPRGVHDLEGWSEAVCDGAWGRPGRWLGERARRKADLEHWSAVRGSFERFSSLVEEVSRGRRGGPPASVLVLSGDVHFSYVAPLSDDGRPGRVVQLVSSPIRNGVPDNLERALRIANSRLGGLIGRVAARTVPLAAPETDWELSGGPWFGNGIATLELDGREARVRFEQVRRDRAGQPELFTVHEERLVNR